MRESVEVALQWLRRNEPPRAFLLAPGDSVGISPELVEKILRRWATATESIVIPTVGGRHGHPVVVPWSLADKIALLPRNRGVNALVMDHPDRVLELETSDARLLLDLDTPEDFEFWKSGSPGLVAPGTRAKVVSRLAIRLFAIAKEKAGRNEITVELPLPGTVGDLRTVLAQQHPSLAALAPRVMIAVGAEYATDETLINPGASVALIPPVSGGS
jgi:molybdopterin converting factor subunit 1